MRTIKTYYKKYYYKQKTYKTENVMSLIETDGGGF